jgi:large subunit ribosomal protein L7/L12
MDINTGSDADRISNLEERVGRLEATVAQLQQQVSASLPPYGPPQTPAPMSVAASAAATASALSASIGVPEAAPDWLAQVRLLKSQGQEINAIKLYRENTGVGLREAKDFVDGLV